VQELKGAAVRLEMLLRCVGAVRVTAVLALKWATSKLALGLWCSSGKFPDIHRLNLIMSSSC